MAGIAVTAIIATVNVAATYFAFRFIDRIGRRKLAIGVGGTGWLLQGEVFPTAVRGRAAAMGATADWVANFAIVLLFPVLLAGIGLAWVMVIFAALAVLAIVFVASFLPETKELSVEQITEVFERQASEGGRAAA